MQVSPETGKLWRADRAIWALFALAMLIRIAVSIFAPVDPVSDYAWYYERGREIAAGLGYQEAGHPTAFWPVGYPGILAGFFLIFGPHVWAGVLGNLLFAAANFWLMLALGRTLGLARREVLIALGCWAIYPNVVFIVPQLASEVPYFPLILAGTLGVLRGGRWGAVLGGLALGVATLVKAQSYLFPIGLFVLLALTRPDYRTRETLVRMVLLHIAMFAVILPWTARNLGVMGQPVMVSTNGGVTLLNGNFDGANGGYTDDRDARVKALYAQTEVPQAERIARQLEFDARAKALGLAWIKEHPGAFLRLMPAKLIGLWLKDGDAGWFYEEQYPQATTIVMIGKVANRMLYFVILIAALLSVWLVRSRGRTEPWWHEAVLFAFPLFITLIALIFSGQMRFHGPAMPFLILAGARLARIILPPRQQVD
jgi:4-amino-4-deoxy-L-arabinose transferase-like glycosyltransferase